MDEYSRPATLEDLKALIRALNEHAVDYLLIGGYALFVHGYYRATTDIKFHSGSKSGCSRGLPPGDPAYNPALRTM